MTAMKNMMRYFRLAALVVMAVVMTGCTKEVSPSTFNGTTYTTTLQMDNGHSKTLTRGGAKTFAVGDKIAVIFKNTSGATVKVVSAALTSSDIMEGGKQAKFSVEIVNPDKTQGVTYIYPASMANDDGTMASIASQDGTWATLSSSLDYCTFTHAWEGDDLPRGTMTNQLAIAKFVVNNTSDVAINNTLTSLTVSDGTNTYTISRTATADTIYVAMLPVSSDKTLTLTATDGTTPYLKEVSGKTLSAGHIYPITVTMPVWQNTYNYTGAVQTFTVPATGYYTLECYGAQGGYSSNGLGGLGGLSQLTYPLTQGDVLYIYVGGQGGCIDGSSSHPEGGDGGWNGGGNGGTGVAWGGGNGDPYNGGGGGGGATHIASSAIGQITGSTDFTSNHANLLLIAGGGGGGLSWGPSAGGAGGGAEGGNGHRGNDQWSIAWNNGALSCGRDGMTSSNGGGSCEGCGGGGAGFVGGNTWTVTYNASNQSYSGAGGSSWGETTNGKGYSTTTGGATAGGNGKAIITWYGTSYPSK